MQSGKVKTLYIHVGLPKTATTMLQRWVFPNIEGVHYLGKFFDAPPQEDGGQSLSLNFLLLNNTKDLEDREVTDLRAVRTLSEVLSHSEKPSLISLESITSQCLSSVPDLFGVAPASPAPSIKKVLMNVKRICNEAGISDVKVIITVRRQSDLLSSFFAQAYMDRLSRVRQTSTFSMYLDELICDEGLIDSGVLSYCFLEDVCKDIFGDESVVFLSLHWMDKDLELFSRELSRFLGVKHEAVHELLLRARPENVRRDPLSGRTLKLKRKNPAYFLDQVKRKVLPRTSLGVGRYVRSFAESFEYGPTVFSPTTDELKRVREFFEDDNACFLCRHTNMIL